MANLPLTALTLYSHPPTRGLLSETPNRETKRRSEATEARNRTARPTGSPAPPDSLRSPPRFQIDVLSSPARLTHLIKPFFPVVPRKQGASSSHSLKGSKRPLSSFLPKEREEKRSHATLVAFLTVLSTPGWAGLGWGPETVLSGFPTYAEPDRPGKGRGGPHPPRLRFASTL